jgi:hypothetical protein
MENDSQAEELIQQKCVLERLIHEAKCAMQDRMKPEDQRQGIPLVYCLETKYY